MYCYNGTRNEGAFGRCLAPEVDLLHHLGRLFAPPSTIHTGVVMFYPMESLQRAFDFLQLDLSTHRSVLLVGGRQKKKQQKKWLVEHVDG